MKKTFINTVISTAFITSLGLVSTNALAGSDSYQEKLVNDVEMTKQKLENAKAAKGVEQDKLLSEHMQMLHENIKVCRQMKPKPGMTELERDEWYTEHQKIMDDMMGQMMEEHKVKMSLKPCDVVKK